MYTRRLCPRLYPGDRGLSPDCRNKGDEDRGIPRDPANPRPTQPPCPIFGLGLKRGPDWPNPRPLDLELTDLGCSQDYVFRKTMGHTTFVHHTLNTSC